MEAKSLELKVMNCKGLKAFNFFQRLSVFAVVSILRDESDKKLGDLQQQRTPTDRKGDADPEWDHKMRFNVSEDSLENISCYHLFLVFDLRSEGFFGGKSIGEVRVPLHELINESSRIVRFMSYEIRNSDGKPNGVLNFSFKVEFKGRNYPILDSDDLYQNQHNQKLHPDFSTSHSSYPYPDRTDYPVNPPLSMEPALYSSPMELLVPSATHEPYPIRYPSIHPPVAQHSYPFQESLYPPVPPTPLEPFGPLSSHSPWVQQYPTSRPPDPYGFAAVNGYNHGYNIWESRPCQNTAVDCGGIGASNGWLPAEQ